MTVVRRIAVLGSVTAGALLLSAHVGSPDVFFKGKAGPYDVRVTVRSPEVIPGIARVTVRTGPEVKRVSIRPVYWRAGTRGAPSPDDARRLAGSAGTFEGSVWLMQRGATAVEVGISGNRGPATVMVPAAAVAIARLDMGGSLAVLLALAGLVLVAGLVTIVHRAAGEGLVAPGEPMDRQRGVVARRIAALSLPVVALGIAGGARWWERVDERYRENLYRPSPLLITNDSGRLHIRLGDSVWQRGVSPLVRDHGKLMHLFLVRADDARAFAHLHPLAQDSSAVPGFAAAMPPLAAGRYHAFGDVVHETGFERTLVGSLTVAGAPAAGRPSDPDDAWYIGDATRESSVRLADGSVMRMALEPNGVLEAGHERTIRVAVEDARGGPARLEPYLGMAAHAVVVRVDGSVYVHLHPMGTVTAAAREVFAARDRGDTTEAGRVRLSDHGVHAPAADDSAPNVIEFPYAFPKGGSYRLFVQVKRSGRILTGAFAVTVGERPDSGPLR